MLEYFKTNTSNRLLNVFLSPDLIKLSLCLTLNIQYKIISKHCKRVRVYRALTSFMRSNLISANCRNWPYLMKDKYFILYKNISLHLDIEVFCTCSDDNNDVLLFLCVCVYIFILIRSVHLLFIHFLCVDDWSSLSR